MAPQWQPVSDGQDYLGRPLPRNHLILVWLVQELHHRRGRAHTVSLSDSTKEKGDRVRAAFAWSSVLPNTKT